MQNKKTKNEKRKNKNKTKFYRKTYTLEQLTQRARNNHTHKTVWVTCSFADIINEMKWKEKNIIFEAFEINSLFKVFGIRKQKKKKNCLQCKLCYFS